MNLFKLIVKIGADTSEADEKIDKTGDKTSSLGEKLSKGLGTVSKAAVAGVAAGATAIAALGTQAISSYSDYEQLVGGVKTLFGTEAETVEEYAASVGKSVDEVSSEYNSLIAAQSTVFDNANNAYKNAGLSANEYMETVTSFAASLVSSVGGDTEIAAKKADLAITDMADNANKMGSSMESIQNAYQGFAKQNYTMLDNLKLGYGGTKEEMQRLLEDANKINAQQGIITDYQIDSYADIVDAIHVVQDEMGIYGTTANEAAGTIQGSIGMMKSAWANLLTGLSDPDQDLGTLMGNLTDSVVTVWNNISPRIQEVLPRITEAISTMIGTLGEQLPGILSGILPSLVDGATSLVTGLMAALPEVLTVLAEIAPTIIETLVPALTELLPQIIETGMEIIVSLAQGVTDALPELIPAVTEAIVQIAETLTNPDSISSLIDAALEIMLALVDGLMEAIPELIEAVPEIISNLIATITENLPKIIEAGVQLTVAVTNGLIQALPQLIAAIPQLVQGIVQGIVENLPTIIAAAPEIIVALCTGLIGAVPDLVAVVPELIHAIADTLEEYDWGSIGKNIVEGIKKGLSDMWHSLTDLAGSLLDNLVGSVESLLGIASPSKVFAGIGGYMAEGLGQGWEKEFAGVKSGIEGQLDFGTTTIGAGTFGATPAVAGATYNISINADRVKQFNDIIRISQNERLTGRMGVK